MGTRDRRVPRGVAAGGCPGAAARGARGEERGQVGPLAGDDRRPRVREADRGEPPRRVPRRRLPRRGGRPGGRPQRAAVDRRPDRRHARLRARPRHVEQPDRPRDGRRGRAGRVQHGRAGRAVLGRAGPGRVGEREAPVGLQDRPARQGARVPHRVRRGGPLAPRPAHPRAPRRLLGRPQHGRLPGRDARRLRPRRGLVRAVGEGLGPRPDPRHRRGGGRALLQLRRRPVDPRRQLRRVRAVPGGGAARVRGGARKRE